MKDISCTLSDEIKCNLKTSFIGSEIIYFDTLDSTNAYAKIIGKKCKDGTVVICEKQTSGRGRLGRVWKSQENNISMSIILKPKISIFQAAKTTQVCAAAVSLALENLGIYADIKWPNDILLNKKKLCGILTEMESEKSKVNFIVVGIGMNINNTYDDFPDEIKDIATSLKLETGKHFKKSSIAAEILNSFEVLYNEFVNNDNFDMSLEICRKKSSILGKKINIIRNNDITRAKAIDLSSEGELIVQYENGEIDSVISGEISVRTVD